MAKDFAAVMGGNIFEKIDMVAHPFREVVVWISPVTLSGRPCESHTTVQLLLGTAAAEKMQERPREDDVKVRARTQDVRALTFTGRWVI